MIAAKTSAPSPVKGAQLDRRAGGNDETRGDLLDTAQRLADRAREVVVQRPATCLAAGFLVGGVVAWLMSKRS